MWLSGNENRVLLSSYINNILYTKDYIPVKYLKLATFKANTNAIAAGITICMTCISILIVIEFHCQQTIKNEALVLKEKSKMNNVFVCKF